MTDNREYVEKPGTGGYRDWIGTASAEEDIVNGPDLYELAGLDRSKWSILGMNLYASGRFPDKDDVIVYAVNTEEIGVDTFDEMQAYAARENGLPVSSIMLHDVDLRTVISCMKSVHIHFRHSGHIDYPLFITERVDHPAQEK
ncbi:hypothetical protein C8E05_3810 [Rhodococcus wratislaviensis]|uniref:Uncharacterized protein n=1 Tax=Rhodococcus wratislaviensis TaxID=44752 RepID=A0AB38FK25_RHOWR|nr:hypothetical protein [Rhodococcus wratislaviensis]REE74375.1 hypothetical protein C8E05_3810 [Rhodococcus wratislaviensis]SPZ42088.1 Uncharacterised protein [Rhodococcus wratislaviensis]